MISRKKIIMSCITFFISGLVAFIIQHNKPAAAPLEFNMTDPEVNRYASGNNEVTVIMEGGPSDILGEISFKKSSNNLIMFRNTSFSDLFETSFYNSSSEKTIFSCYEINNHYFEEYDIEYEKVYK